MDSALPSLAESRVFLASRPNREEGGNVEVSLPPLFVDEPSRAGPPGGRCGGMMRFLLVLRKYVVVNNATSIVVPCTRSPCSDGVMNL